MSGYWDEPEAMAWARTLTTTQLHELLRERGPGETIPTSHMEEREEAQPCVVCGELIAPGQAYAVKGPRHIGCR